MKQEEVLYVLNVNDEQLTQPTKKVMFGIDDWEAPTELWMEIEDCLGDRVRVSWRIKKVGTLLDNLRGVMAEEERIEVLEHGLCRKEMSKLGPLKVKVESLDGRMRGMARVFYQSPSIMRIGGWAGEIELEHFDWPGRPKSIPLLMTQREVPTNIGCICINEINNAATKCKFIGQRRPEGELLQKVQAAMQEAVRRD